VLEAMPRQFALRVCGFHSDNGSAFLNRVVADLLKSCCPVPPKGQTESRARRSGDNGLVETKNAAIARQHIGFGHNRVRPRRACQPVPPSFLNPYLNFHRPYAPPEVEIDAKGRKRRRYKQWPTPLEKLLSLDPPEQHLRTGRSMKGLKRHAGALSDTEAARKSRLRGSPVPGYALRDLPRSNHNRTLPEEPQNNILPRV